VDLSYNQIDVNGAAALTFPSKTLLQILNSREDESTLNLKAEMPTFTL